MMGLVLTFSPVMAFAAEQNDSSQEQSQDQQPPEKPDGEAADGQGGPGGQAPDGKGGEKPDGEKPDGEAPDGQGGHGGQATDGEAPEKPDGEAPDGQGGPGGQAPDGQGGPGGMSEGVDSYAAVNAYEEDAEVSDEEINSTGADENAILLDGDAVLNLKNLIITRQSEESSSADNSSFYGVGAAVLATDGTLNISDSTITTDAMGGAGIFAYGDGVVYAADNTITTSQDASGGIHVAGGGTLYAWDNTVETSGQSSAAVRSDRGSGTMVVEGGSYTSSGKDSPAVYSTADISIHEAELTALASEAVCLEGLNSIRLYDCDLSGNMSDDERNNDNTWTVILYQSMSGDAEDGNGLFQMTGGALTSENGGLFYTTNTESTFILQDVDITASEDCEYFLRCTGNDNSRGWGNSGANGADCSFTAIEQDMTGDVIWDSISNLDFYICSGSSLTGAFVDDESCAGEGGDGSCDLIIDQDSSWVVTADSQLTSLSCEGLITDTDGKTVSVVGEDGTVYVEGESEFTITVESYSDTADTSGASSVDEWSNHEVERPAEL